jgi:hypothetical protein
MSNQPARIPQVQRLSAPMLDQHMSDDLRRRYLAWVGPQRSARKCLEIAGGKVIKNLPLWFSDGRISLDWADRMERQMKV